MSTSEGIKRRFVPPEGTYIAFTIDPEATFAKYDCPIDDVAEQGLRKFPRETYVGFVSFPAADDFPLPQNAFNKVDISPIQRGLTVPIPDYNVTPDMCMPVHPETRHPHDRPPMKVNKPLPWSECYHSTCHSISAWLPQGRKDYSEAYIMDTQDQCLLMIYAAEDSDTRKGIVHRDDSESEDEVDEMYHEEFEKLNDAKELEDILDLIKRRRADKETECLPDTGERVSAIAGPRKAVQVAEDGPHHSLTGEDEVYSLSGDYESSIRSERDGFRELEQPDRDDDIADVQKRTYPVVRFTPDIETVKAIHAPRDLNEDVFMLRRYASYPEVDAWPRRHSTPFPFQSHQKNRIRQKRSPAILPMHQ